MKAIRKFQNKEFWATLNSGQAIVIIGLAAIGLIAMMGLAIDGGRLMMMKRDTQNAADAAAIAAARALCTGREPAPYALAAAKENGFDNDEADYSVEVYSPPITPGIALEDECKGCFVEVVLKASMDPTFIGIVYKGDLETTSRAIGVCSPDIDAGMIRADHVRAVWAMSETCSPNPVDINGNSMYVEGGMHSNGYMKVMPGGAGGTFVGPVSHSKGWEVDSNKNADFQTGVTVNDSFFETVTGPCLASCFTDEQKVGCGCWGDEEVYPETNPYLTPPVKDYPVSYNITHYQPDGTEAKLADAKGEYYVWNCSGPAVKFTNWLLDNHVKGTKMDNGIYYANCDIKIDKLEDVTGNVTIVSTGTITVNGDNQQWGPYTQELLLFSNANKGCNDAIHFSGSDNTWNGMVFAPRGRIQLSGSLSSSDINGCLIGNAVKIGSSDIQIICEAGKESLTVDPALWLAE